jgi:DNA-directed RNA polymerase alpha subunit
MRKNNGTLRLCSNGHRYYKSSDYPTCPSCEKEKKPKTGFLAKLSGPARQALEAAHITALRKLSQHTEREVLSLHGMGPKSLPTLKKALREKGLSYRR